MATEQAINPPQDKTKPKQTFVEGASDSLVEKNKKNMKMTNLQRETPKRMDKMLNFTL